MFSIPFRLGGYLQPIEKFLMKIHKNPNKFFLLTTLFIFFIGPIMSIVVIKILHDLLGNFKVSSKLLAKSYLGGYSTVVIWSPYHSSAALVLYYLNVSISEYFPLALGLSIFLLNGLFWINKNPQTDYITEKEFSSKSNDSQKNSMKKLLI